MDSIDSMPVVRLDPGQYLADLLPVRDGALVGEVMIGSDQRLHAVCDGLIWTATSNGTIPTAQVASTARHIQGLDRSWPGLSATNGHDTVLASTDLTVRPTRADQVRAGDIVRWMGLTCLVKHVRQVDEEKVGLRFWAAGYDVSLYAAHPVDVIVFSRPAPVGDVAGGRGLTEAELGALPLGSRVTAAGLTWKRVRPVDGTPWEGVWAAQDRQTYGWRLSLLGPVTLEEDHPQPSPHPSC